jgi:Flp pilus assembly protein TadG
MASQRRRLAQKGVSLIVGTASMVLLIPSAGLSIDAAMLYYTKARLQGAVDGAALGAARALSLGSTTQAQAASAKQNAVNWFYADFPSTLWGTSNTQMDSSMVTVADDPNNPHLQNVTVTANTTVPTIFMRWFNTNSTVVAALGTASRRDAVMMMVLDRSGSMGSACGDLKDAAKIFTGQFAEGRDQIGLVTFADNVTMQQAPTTDFQTILGYTNNAGSGTGLIDAITCTGGTNTPAAISIAYNELYKANLPGALNLLLFETDGLPNIATVNLWDSSSNSAGIANSSNCLDRNNVKKGAGGFGSAAASPYWQGNGTTPTYSMGSGGFRADVPAGMIGGFGGLDTTTSFWQVFRVFSPTPNAYLATGNFPSSGFPACFSNTGHSTSSIAQDVAWLPTSDVFGNNMVTSYKSVSTTGGHVTSITGDQLRAMAFNASDSAALQARTNANLPVSLFGIGFRSAVDHVLMQRMANDPNGDSTVPYPPCASAVNCVTYASQPQGTYVYAADTSQLAPAFLKLSSQILRLSK